MSKQWIVAAALAAALPLLCGGAAVAAENQVAAKAGTMPLEVSSQTRLRIYPRYPRRRGELLPNDYYYYPGINGVRQCQSWLQRELRASGPVITPQMRCRWVPG
jgi:hypothetical protein